MSAASAKALSRSRGRAGWGPVPLIALSLTVTACSRQPAPPPAEPAATELAQQQPAPAPATATPAPAPEPTPTTQTPLTAEGWGPLKIGMMRAEVVAALGEDANPEAVGGPDPESCDQFRPARAPEGMLVMIERGRLTSITLMPQAKVRTDAGVGVGATAGDVRQAYRYNISSSLHKYEAKPAVYLVHWAKGGGPADGAVPPGSRGIKYEVNGRGVVAMIHAGGPSILYVEGCS